MSDETDALARRLDQIAAMIGDAANQARIGNWVGAHLRVVRAMTKIEEALPDAGEWATEALLAYVSRKREPSR